MNIRRTIAAFALAVLFLGIGSAAHAQTAATGTIDLNRNFAWGDTMGWVNFAPTDAGGAYDGLVITDSAITGFAWSSRFGWINFSPVSSGQGVTNTPSGTLGGSAWVASLGWLDMTGATIDSNGEFHGTVGTAGAGPGRIAFDCSTCDVHTTWRPTSAPAATSSPSSPGNPGGGGGPSTSQIGSITGGGGGSTTALATLVPALLGTGTAAGGGIVPGNNAGLAAAAVQSGAARSGLASALASQLLDVSMDLDEHTLIQGEPVMARVSMVNFGTLPTVIGLSFSVVGASGALFATSSATTTIQTESTYVQAFNHLVLQPGSYTVHLHTLYNGTVEDDFWSPFTVTAASAPLQAAPMWLFWVLILLMLLAILAFYYFFIWKRRERDRDDAARNGAGYNPFIAHE